MSRIRITGATAVLTPDAEPLLAHDVVILNGLIEDVEDRNHAVNRPDERVVKVNGGWLVPGLIDLHSHLTLHNEAPERDEYHPASPFLSARAARLNLAAGVTTCRDLGGHQHVDIELRNAVRRGDVPGPRLLAAGKPIVCTGGHIHYFAREADGPSEVRKAVREQLKAGADLIKIMLTGGSANVGEQPERLQLRPQELNAAIEEANEADRPVAVHAHTGRAVDLAARAGATTVEHAALLDDVGIEALVDTGCALVPTQAVYRRIASNVDGWEQEKADNAQRLYERKTATLAKAIRAGVQIGVGTDSGRHFPHGQIVIEMTELVDAGMDASAVFDAATRVNASLAGLGEVTGQIQKGYAADLALVRSDPRQDLGVLATPRLVVAAGRVYDPSVLSH